MTDAELKELVASIAITQRETAQQQKETERLLKDLGKDTDLLIEELNKQIAGLGEKFGSLTEGLALPSMQKILNERFDIEIICPSVRAVDWTRLRISSRRLTDRGFDAENCS